MKYVYPDYYKYFACIKGECKHNCCIGWEIDIDDETAQHYKNVKGELGKKLKANIAVSEPCHFILSENERCPFLNGDNLCELIIELGEDSLCSICKLHPRFFNELPDRVEVGLGLCCEAAARLILQKKEPTVLECESGLESDDEIILLRDRVILVLQQRERSIGDRVCEMLTLCNVSMPDLQPSALYDILLGLERLDESWSCILEEAKALYEKVDLSSFDKYMEDRQSEYEQLLVYFIYRHFANAPTVEDTRCRAVFTFFAWKILYSLGAVKWHKTGKLSIEDHCELVRLFSSETEYSEDNLYYLFDLFDEL